MVVVSELRGNPRGLEIGSDFAGLADAARARFLPASAAAESVVWYAHHGGFSSYDPAGPETLTRIPLRWTDEHYQEAALAEHELLDPAQHARTTAALHLEPVEDVLAAWGWDTGPDDVGQGIIAPAGGASPMPG